jgi:O-antigen ligase
VNYAVKLPENGLAESGNATESGDRAVRGTGPAFFFLLLVTVLYYTHPEDFFPVLGSLHLAEVAAICAIASYLWARMQGGVPFVWPTEMKIMFALTFWYAAGIPFAIWRGGSFQTFTQTWLKTVLIVFLLNQTLLTLARVRRLVGVIILCELIVAFGSILTAPAGVLEGTQRMRGTSAYGGVLSVNEFSIALSTTLPFLAAFLIRSRSIVRSGLMICIFGILMRMAVLNASRGGFICVGVSSILALVLMRREVFRRQLAGLLFVAVLLLAGAFAPGIFWQRIRTIWETPGAASDPTVASAVESSEQRERLFWRSVDYTLENPIFGLGLGNFTVASGTRTGRSSEWKGTHNTFTEVSSEAGIPALLLYVGLRVVVLRRMWKLSKDCARDPARSEMVLLARATWVSLCTFMVGAMFAHFAYNLYSHYLVVIGIGLQTVMQRTRKEESAAAVNGKPRVGENLQLDYDKP